MALFTPPALARAVASDTARQRVVRSGPVLAALLMVGLIAPPVSAPAQSSAQKELERLEREQAKREQKASELEQGADAAAREIADLRQRLVEAARAREALERDVERSEVRLRRLRRDEQAMSARLAADRGAMENIVVALIGVERDRPPALAVSPGNAAEAARAAILMGTVAPHLEERTQDVSRRIGELQSTRTAILMENEAYRTATMRLAEARRTVGALISQRRELEQRLRREAGVEREALAQIAQRASDLRDLIARLGVALPDLDREAGGPAFARGFSQAQGKLLWPVGGEVATDFGDRLEEGGRATGITIAARPGSQVVAPYDGRVEFAGVFRSWGQVVILNVGDGSFVVLAGLGGIYAQAGQEVLAGEPLGEMNPASEAPELYLEIRSGEQPLDPAAWLVPQRADAAGGSDTAAAAASRSGDTGVQ
jgi:murein hydrolase activator